VNECPECDGEMEEQTSVPLTTRGSCEVYLVCENCGHEELVGKDSVL
jgi:hypothetical protein